MTITRRGMLALAASLPWDVQGGSKRPGISSDSVHRELVDGNRRFATGHVAHPHSSLRRVRQTARGGQHPHAVVLCCSDSRVVPELLFDQGIGDLFTVRVAGNIVNEDEVASIEYAVEHFDVPLCVVLGHTSCGAVSAVVAGGHEPAEVEHLVARIQDTLARVRAQHPELGRQALIEATVRANVEDSMLALAAGPQLLAERVHSGRLRIEGGVYDLERGLVKWLIPAAR